MTVVELTIAVADAAIGKNLLLANGYNKSKFNRRLVGIGLTGGNAAEQVECVIKYGSTDVGRIKNVKTGLVIDSMADVRPHSSLLVCKPDEELAVEVVTAPTVNPIKLFCNIQET